jgi:hypothetical protein
MVQGGQLAGRGGGHLTLGRICKQRCSVTSLKVFTLSAKKLAPNIFWSAPLHSAFKFSLPARPFERLEKKTDGLVKPILFELQTLHLFLV